MSHEEGEKFIEKINKDETFRKKILGAKDLDARIKLINEEGIYLTMEEINRARRVGIVFKKSCSESSSLDE